jgi:O-antigen/teichoic acid export membrane protein
MRNAKYSLRELSRLLVGDSEFARLLIKGTLGSGALKIASILVSLAVSVLLARNLGPNGYGGYTFAYSLMTILAIPTQLGLPSLVVREVARYQLKGEWALMKGLLIRSNQAVLSFSLLIALCAIPVIRNIAAGDDGRWNTIWGWAFLLVPLIALGNLRAATLRGLRRVVLGQLPDMFLRPCTFLVLSSTVAVLSYLTPARAMSLHVIAAGVAFIVGAVLLHRALPGEAKAATAMYRTREWAAAVMPMAFLAGMDIFNREIDIVMLRILGSHQDVGLYRVAMIVSILAVLGLTIINPVVLPYLSRLYSGGQRQKLQTLLTWSARTSFLTALCASLLFFLFGRELIALFFGTAYLKAYLPVCILLIGQMVHAFVGPVGFALQMTGHQHIPAKIIPLILAMKVVSNAILIPAYGIMGAAITSALSIAILNITLCYRLRKVLGLRSMPLSYRITKMGTIHET